VGNPAIAVFKSARFWAVLAGLVLVPPALLALDIYFVVAGTPPERVGAAAVAAVAVVASWIWRGVLRWRRRPSAG
jgi:hypothetical protein